MLSRDIQIPALRGHPFSRRCTHSIVTEQHYVLNLSGFPGFVIVPLQQATTMPRTMHFD